MPTATRILRCSGHMGLCILLLSRLAHISPPLAWQMFRVMPTSVSTILFTDIGGGFAQTKIFSVGDTSHLAPIGLTYRGGEAGINESEKCDFEGELFGKSSPSSA